MAANGRRTTYVREFYVLREAGKLDGLGIRALDVLAYICHLADRYGRDAVFKRQREVCDVLGCEDRTLRDALAQLDGFEDPDGRAVVYLDAHRAAPGRGYRRATMFQLGPAFPDAARWLNRQNPAGSHEDARGLAQVEPAESRQVEPAESRRYISRAVGREVEPATRAGEPDGSGDDGVELWQA